MSNPDSRWVPWLASVSVGLLLAGSLVLKISVSESSPPSASPPSSFTACPWVSASLQHNGNPLVLAKEVVSKMTLAEKASFVVLAAYGPLENRNSGIARLCIPPISLSDGPNGIANGVLGVTQFPAALAVGASFNPDIARSVGTAVAQEARLKGLDVVQGPNLNLARVAKSGRIFETYGEDPYLTSALGVASIDGIQSVGVMANAKHVGAYTQETARMRLNQIVPIRAMAELYNIPFRAAVEEGQVASLMCSYGSLNGVNTCSDPYVYSLLRSWGFSGFVRSDLASTPNIAAAFRAGISLMKPASVKGVLASVKAHTIRVEDLDRAVTSVLTEMFRFKMIGRPPSGSLTTVATSLAHDDVALRAAEAGIVLLKNRSSTLPLSKPPSIAVIGAPANESPLTSGGGSSAVSASSIVTPLQALRAQYGVATRVTYSVGGPSSLNLDQLNDVDVVNGTPLKLITPIRVVGEPGKSDIAIEASPNVTAALATATRPGAGEGWNKWSLIFRPKLSGTYEIAIQQSGDTWAYLNGREILASPGVHARIDMSTTAALVAGHQYVLSARWFAIANAKSPTFALLNVSREIAAAVQAARNARVAIVFAGDYTTEGADRTSLALPGVANALIAAVASVNPRTIVVLNTGGAVVMPWLSKVSAVLEAWYPGQTDGTAIARVIAGVVDPSGRLPITFPASDAAMPATSSSQFPGVNSTVSFGNGLDVGYRWYQANNVVPLFAFGYGLAYTSFALSSYAAVAKSGGATVSVTVTNTGSRSGSDVVQVYVHYPVSAGEPPEQLRSFARVSLAPKASQRVTLTLSPSAFQVFENGKYQTLPGRYRIDIGESSSKLTGHLTIALA